MRLFSWNVNGLRAVLGKTLPGWLEEVQPDVLVLQEIKARPEQVKLPACFEPYELHWNSARRPGYSGTLLLTRRAAQEVHYGIGRAEHDEEGRVITARLDAVTVVTVYTPNSGNELARLPYRLEWEKAFANYLDEVRSEGRPVLVGGDFNVAHREMDLARPQANRRSAGFTDEEREAFGAFLERGWVDSFRHFHPEATEAYSWWSYRGGARKRNVGWRIDYWCVSEDFVPRLGGAAIHSAVEGSDHCPVEVFW